jgi:hypothetical protein
MSGDQGTARLRELAEKATPGPWVAWGTEPRWPGDGRGAPRINHKPGDGTVPKVAVVDSWDRQEENRDLIVALVNALPRLLAVVDAARGLVAAEDAWPDGDETKYWNALVDALDDLEASHAE